MASAPPTAAARSRIEASPTPPDGASGANPWPSSATSRMTRRGVPARRTLIAAAPECRSALCSASWATRYSAASGRGPSAGSRAAVNVTGIPYAAAGQHRVPAQRGGQPAVAQVRRGQPVDHRAQLGVGLRAERADHLDLGLDPAASTGSRPASTAAARACARMLNSFCVTASCSSLASRDRSCSTDSSRLCSYSRALVSAMAACAANRERISSSRSVNPRLVRGGGDLVGREDDAEDPVAVAHRHPEEVRHPRMGGRPALEPRVLADIREPFRLALGEQHAQHPVPAGQRADGLLLGRADPVHHELGERIALVGHAERGVARADQRPRRPHDHLQHVADGHLPGDRQHRLAHRVRARPARPARCSPTRRYPGGAIAASGAGPRTIGPGRPRRTADARGRAGGLASGP